MGEARIRVDVSARTVELEGTESFVSSNLDRFDSILRGLISVSAQDASVSDANDNEENEPTEEMRAKTTRARRTPRVAKGGVSCAQRILGLKSSDFFKAPRRAGDIVVKLREAATPYAAKNVRAALTDLTRRGELRRITASDGQFEYVNP